MSRITGILIITMLLFGSFLAAIVSAQEGELAAVRSEGASAKRNQEEAREEAIKVALRKAVIGKINEIARLSLEEKTEIERAFKNNAGSYVAKYDSIPVLKGKKGARVVLDVYVMADRLVDKLIELGFTANLIYKPKILVVMNESEGGKPSSKRTLTTLITQKVLDNGFKAVMPKSKLETRRILRQIEESEEGIAELAKKYKCDVIVTGESDVEETKIDLGIDLGPYKNSWRATASIEAILCDNEEVLFSLELSEAATALTKALGVKRAYESLVEQIGSEALQGLLRGWTIEVMAGKTLPSPDPIASAPPQLVVFAPDDKTVTTEASIRLRGEASDDVSVAGVKILVNGMDIALTKDIHLVANRNRFRDVKIRPAGDVEGQTPDAGTYQFNRSISLRQGKNTIQIISIDSDNNRTAATRAVIYEPPESDREKSLKILIYSPNDEEVSNSEAVQLRGEVAAEEDIAQVQIIVNGEEIPVKRDIHLVRIGAGARQKEHNYHIDNNVPLAQKRNLIHIVASTTSGVQAEKYITVIRREDVQTSSVQLAIYAPLDKFETSEESVRIRGEVLSEEGIAEVIVNVNGEPLLTKRDLKITPASSGAKFSKAAYDINQTAMLQVGENIIKIVAQTASGKTAEIELAVTRLAATEANRLQIVIESPADEDVVAKESVRLIGKIVGSEPVTDREISVNGVPIPRERDINIVRVQGAGRESSETPIDKTILLVPGDNTIKIECSTETGLKAVKSLAISRAASAEPQKPETQEEIANKYAVIIGIGNYQDANIPKLRFARKDAESLYALVTDPQTGGFPKENVRLLVDEGATLKAIKSTIGNWLAKSVTPEDMVLLFYSGHGGVDADPSGEEADGLNKYIIPSDAKLNDLYSTALLNAELSIMLDRVRSNQFIFLIDCCYSGGATNNIGAMRTISNTKVSSDIYGQLANQGRVVISASRPEQVSFEVTQLGHGIFTYHLLDGLKGKANIDRNAFVSLMEMYLYLSREVNKTAQSLGVSQIPTFKGNVAGDIVLTKTKNAD